MKVLFMVPILSILTDFASIRFLSQSEHKNRYFTTNEIKHIVPELY